MLNTFCGYRLNSAGVVIGWVGAVWSLLIIVLISIGLSRIDELTKWVAQNLQDPSIDQATINSLVLVYLCIFITINAINLAASALLIAGTVKERHLLLLPWIINHGVSLILSGIYVVSMIVTPIVTNAPFGAVAFSVISGVFGLVLEFYIWYAIYSLFKQIQANRDVQQRLIPATSSSYPSYTKI